MVIAEEPVEQGRLAKGAVVREGQPLGVAGGPTGDLQVVDQLERGEVLRKAITGPGEGQGVGGQVEESGRRRW